VAPAVYASYVAVAGESAIIDSDHGRHYFLLVGVLWGLTIEAGPCQRGDGGFRVPNRAAVQPNMAGVVPALKGLRTAGLVIRLTSRRTRHARPWPVVGPAEAG
jgi:hypothetical protein